MTNTYYSAFRYEKTKHQPATFGRLTTCIQVPEILTTYADIFFCKIFIFTRWHST